MKGGLTLLSWVTTLITMMWIGFFIFWEISVYLVGTGRPNSCSMSSPSEPGRRIFYLTFCWKWGLSYFKSFTAWSFVDCDNNWLFLILYKEYWISLCTICLISDSDTLISLAMNLIDLLGLLNISQHYLPDKWFRHSHIPGYESDWLARIVEYLSALLAW